MVVLVLTYRYMVAGPSYYPARESMMSRICIVTCCYTGIGYETAIALPRAGGTVIFACRSEGRARQALQRLSDGAKGVPVTDEHLVFLPSDLSSFKSVRSFAQQFEKLDVALHLLILNAGVMLSSRGASVANTRSAKWM